MSTNMTESLAQEILRIASSVPPGRVTTYGQIARLLGRPQNARLVGRVLSRAEWYGDGTELCHRVVNHAGRTVPGWSEQRRLLEAEGVPFRENGRVDMKRALWDGE